MRPTKARRQASTTFVASVCACILVVLCHVAVPASDLFINEVMSSNASTIADEDGDYSDWMEIYNAGSAAADLDGYGLTDDPDDLFRWTFPPIMVSPGEHLLLFASDKNRKEVIHWETIINQGDEWRYRMGSSEPPSNWYRNGFDDSAWPTGPSGFGYGDGDDATVVPATMSLCVRKEFDVAACEEVRQAVLHVDYDDAFVAYLNGMEIARANIGQVKFRPSYNQPASSDREAIMYQGASPASFEDASILPLLQSTGNVLALQVHNNSVSSSDLTLIPFLSLGYSSVPDEPRGAPDILNLPGQNLHANFKIKSEGETLVLSDPNGRLVDRIEANVIPADVSLGRSPDGTSHLILFQHPTPGTANGGEGYEGMVDAPRFSRSGGFCSTAFNLSITLDTPGVIIRYTTDGSQPDESATQVLGIIPIYGTTVVRARGFMPGWLPSQTVTHTYLFDLETALPVMSLSTDPANLWDEETGIYAYGDSYSPDFPYFGANFWEDWERPIHVELFETRDDADLALDAGVKIYGGWSRAYPEKSLAVFARSAYGYSEIDYPLFPEQSFQLYQAFVLRNGGNDWESTMLRDGLAGILAIQLDIDAQAYRPVAVLLNGEYWGIHGLREKINEHFLASNHNVDPDRVDRLEGNRTVLQGDSEHYDMTMDFVENHDLSMQENYDSVQTMMDVNNFIRYQIAEIFIDNRDWPGNNVKYWRSRTPDGKWRWIFYDADFGFGLYNPSAYVLNTLEFATEPFGPDWPNPPWSTFLLRKLLESESFRCSFINTFCDHLNTTLASERTIPLLHQLQDDIAVEMPRHISRWNRIGNWNANVDVIEEFLLNRVPYVRIHLQQFFELDNMVALHLAASPEGAGEIRINSILVSDLPWQGHYFPNLPMAITACPKEGFRFSGWDDAMGDSSVLSFTLTGNMSLRALFEAGGDTELVVINEINYNSAENEFNPEDWIELHNAGNTTIALGNWIFKDSEDGHAFAIGESVTLTPDAYVVLCRDTVLFKACFPEVRNFLGEVSFGLSGDGEYIRLYNQAGSLVDSVNYDDKAPWPEEADGDGATLELIDAKLDNGLAESWEASSGHGTPGSENSVSDGDSVMTGDVNQDEQVNILDVVSMVNHILNIQVLDGVALKAADCNNDGAINVLDAVGIVNVILGGGECGP